MAATSPETDGSALRAPFEPTLDAQGLAFTAEGAQTPASAIGKGGMSAERART